MAISSLEGDHSDAHHVIHRTAHLIESVVVDPDQIDEGKREIPAVLKTGRRPISSGFKTELGHECNGVRFVASRSGPIEVDRVAGKSMRCDRPTSGQKQGDALFLEALEHDLGEVLEGNVHGA
jgi:hypothetical protein